MADNSKRTKNSLGKEKVGDKLGKNKPKHAVRQGTQMIAPSRTGMKGSMGRGNRTRYTS